jgi:hypothetical protein
MKGLRYSLLFGVFFTLSCETKLITVGVDCDECYTDRFSQADIVIKINAFEAAEYIWLEVYEGTVDEGDLIFGDTALYTDEFFYVDVNKEYSARATYYFDSNRIVAIDGTKIRRRYVNDACESECYIIEDETIDLRLKGY